VRVDHSRRSIFIAIPKTASKSVAEAFFQEGEQIGGSHAGADFLTQYIAQCPAVAHYFKFAFVRNPWDRALSTYQYFRETRGLNGRRDQEDYSRFYSRFDTFEAFLRALERSEESHFLRHLRPQVEFLWPNSRQPRMDFVGRFEALERDVQRLMHHFGVTGQFPRIHQTHRGDYRNYYSEETCEIVKRVYREDVEILGYSFHGNSIEECDTRNQSMFLPTVEK
jgi:chondroitin 4-sulfotransferase 11